MKHCDWPRRVVPFVVLLCAGSGGVYGQASQPVPASLPTVNYADPGFGFELKLPAGWGYDRARFQEYKDSLGLLRGRSPDGQQGLQIQVFRSFRMQPFEDWVVDFVKAVGETADAARVEWETWKLPPRVGALLTYSSKIAAVMTRTHCLCVPFDPNTVWVLVYTSPMANEGDAQRLRKEFDQIISTLQIRYDAEAAEKLGPALDRGKTLLAKLRDLGAKAKLDDGEYYYDIVLAGKSIGYLRRRITREEYVFSAPSAKRRVAKEGVRVRERSWRFADDGTVRRTRLDLFCGFDLQSELIEHEQIQIPAPDVQPPQLLTKTDQVVREADVLFSSFRTSLDRALPNPSKPISVGPVYLGLAWARLLPGLLLGGAQEAHAFAIYDTETRALLSHQITPLGEKKVPGNDSPAYAFEIREGFIDRPSTVYTDRRGTLLRLEAGELVVVQVSREEIEKKYGQRRDAARQRFSLPDD